MEGSEVRVGEALGSEVGDTEGPFDGELLCEKVGTWLGITVIVGTELGAEVGESVGFTDGELLCFKVGDWLGFAVIVGGELGFEVAGTLSSDGSEVGDADSFPVSSKGSTVTVSTVKSPKCCRQPDATRASWNLSRCSKASASCRRRPSSR